MGVKDLWTILSPVCERKSLYELQDKAIAVDLSCWVVEDQSLGTFSAQPRMYLRNLFFRTTCLLLLGVKPIFVLEGEAPTLKHDTMAKRNEIQFKSYRKNTQQSQDPTQTQSSQGNRKKGTRSRLKSLLKQCAEMLRIMGVCCVQSSGEAEALCAQLNSVGLVDGCITQDGDCFLYGATTVYRNFTISATGGSHSSGYSVDVYHMDKIRGKLQLDRQRLVALSLLCGCDYGQGVAGVGKQLARTFLDTLEQGEDVLDRLRRWRWDPYYERLERERAVLTTASLCDNCCHAGKQAKHQVAGCKECGSKLGCHDNISHRVLTHTDTEERKVLIAELNLRKKALVDPDFPSQEMIDEFLARRPTPDTPDLDWKEPNLAAFVKFSVSLLAWTDTYAVEKFLPLATRWQLLYFSTQHLQPVQLTPTAIVRTRVQKGVASYEVRWEENTGLFDWLCLDDGVTELDLLVTVEPQTLVNAAYPALVEAYLKEQDEKKKAKKKPTRKKAAVKLVEEPFKQTKMSQFLPPSQSTAADHPKDRDPRSRTAVEEPFKSQFLPPSVEEPFKQTELSQFLPPSVKEPFKQTKMSQFLPPSSTAVDHPTDRNPPGRTSVKGRTKKTTSVVKKPQVTITSLLNSVRIIEANKVAAAAQTTGGKRNNASPRLKVGFKPRKMTKTISTPKKMTLDSLADLETSFRNVSLIDYEDDDGDFSDLSAIIDGIVGDDIQDSVEIREKYRTRFSCSEDEDKENVVSNVELGNEVPLASNDSDGEKDEFDFCNHKYVPLYERLKAQSQAMRN